MFYTKILCWSQTVTEGLPVRRWEHGYRSNILDRADSLSSLSQDNLQIRKGSLTDMDATTRQSRSTSPLDETFDPAIFGTKLTTLSDSNAQKLDDASESSAKKDQEVVVAVRVSSSVGKESSKRVPVRKTAKNEDRRNVLVTEEQPSLIAEANKNEFSVEESEPITINNDATSTSFRDGYPAAVRPLANVETAAFEYQQAKDKSKLQNYQHETVIYHNNPRDPARARSVSYSTVIQSLPQIPKTWEGDKLSEMADLPNRRFDESGMMYANNYEAFTDTENGKPFDSFNHTQTPKLPLASMAESKDYYVTSEYNPPEYNESTEKLPSGEISPWRKSHSDETVRNVESTERNWESQNKQYATQSTSKLPTVYGHPEQNYEVDESVSLMTNGRTHGIQNVKMVEQKLPTATSAIDGRNVESTTDSDGQKVGYVVEGRNFRKYRVEERTSDGFIVGEYGVVSHNDGTLRGVRYTADGTINPRLIYDALMKFLSL